MKPRGTAACFPSSEEGLLLRSPLTQTYTPPNYHSKSLLYSRNVRPEMFGYYSEILDSGNTPKSTNFYTRHNPHPVRVKHLKGLLDNPVCMVEDNLERRILWSAPSGEDLRVVYRPHGNTRYSANRSKHIPAVGIVPVTYAWKDELEKKTYNAISKALGQVPLPPIQGGIRTEKREFDSIEDDQLLNLLCKILQTDSIPACQAWLQTASDTEKTIVLNMLRMAATGEINQLVQPHANPTTRPNTAQSLYIWNPKQAKPEPSGSDTIHQENQHRPDLWDSNLLPQEEESSFKLPVHDTIIRSALSAKHGDEKQTFHDRLQNELDQIDVRKLHSRASSRRIASAYNRPVSAGIVPSRPQSRNKPRSYSTGSRGMMKRIEPPVKVHISGAV